MKKAKELLRKLDSCLDEGQQIQAIKDHFDELNKQLILANTSRNFNMHQFRTANTAIKTIDIIIDNEGTTDSGKLYTIQALIRNYDQG
jgi:hypothetical protein